MSFCFVGYFAYRANAIGENDEQIKETLRSEANENMTIEEGIKFAFSIFKKIMGKNFEIERFDVGYIKHHDPKLVRLHGEHVKKYAKEKLLKTRLKIEQTSHYFHF
jgi:20S proteasome alpha/beta subunit